MFHHDPALSGVATSEAPGTNNLLWSYDTGGIVRATPTIVDGKVYIGNMNGAFRCLDGEDGSVIWSFSSGSAIYSSAAVADGRVFFLTSGGTFWCKNAANGATNWSHAFGGGGTSWSSPAVHDGNVFIADGSGTVYSFVAATGFVNWSTYIGGYGNGPITVVNGKVYSGTHNFDNAAPTLVALNEADGTVAWTYDYFAWHGGVTAFVNSNGAAVVDGDDDGDLEVYFGVVTWTGGGPQAICLDEATGNEVWAQNIGGWSTSTPAVHDGKVYIGSDDNNMYALDAATGAYVWNYTTGDDVWSAPAVASGLVIFGSLDHTIYAVKESDGSLVWSYFTGASRLLGSPAVADGRVYTGNENYNVYAFATLAYVDIKPTSCPNPFNTKAKGKLPVAVLGTNELDVTTIDPPTVLLEGVAPLRWSYEDVATPYTGDLCGCREDGPDGWMDLVLHYDRQAVYATMGDVTDGEYRELRVTMLTQEGYAMEGADCVWIKHKVKDPPVLPPTTIKIASFDASTSIIYLSLADRAEASVVVHDVLGRRVKTLVNGALPAGNHTIQWDGRDAAGNRVASGVYFCHVQAGTVNETGKIVMMK
jgi:outer membrane protein assembly factor BamB